MLASAVVAGAVVVFRFCRRRPADEWEKSVLHAREIRDALTDRDPSNTPSSSSITTRPPNETSS